MGWLNLGRPPDRPAPPSPSGLKRAGSGLAVAPASSDCRGQAASHRDGIDAEPASPPASSTEPAGPSEPAAAGGSLPEEWFHRHFDVLWRLVARLGVSGHSIDDVVQETYIVASRRRSVISEGQERRFLIGTAVRLSSNHRQRAHVRREVSVGDRLELEASNVPDAEHLLIEKDLRSRLDAALATLPDAQREIFVLYELEGFSTPEIAEMLGVPLGTVASRLARARSSFSRVAARTLQTELP